MGKVKDQAAANSSTPRTDPEAFTHSEPHQGPKAGDLRRAGYGVADSVPDDEVPGSYSVDSIRTDAEAFLVAEPSQDLVLTDQTPAEFHAKQAAGADIEKANLTTLTMTPAEKAVQDSKGSDAEKQGPRPSAGTLDVTAAQAAGTPEA